MQKKIFLYFSDSYRKLSKLYQTEISSKNICFDEEFKSEIRFWWKEGENF